MIHQENQQIFFFLREKKNNKHFRYIYRLLTKNVWVTFLAFLNDKFCLCFFFFIFFVFLCSWYVWISWTRSTSSNWNEFHLSMFWHKLFHFLISFAWIFLRILSILFEWIVSSRDAKSAIIYLKKHFNLFIASTMGCLKLSFYIQTKSSWCKLS